MEKNLDRFPSSPFKILGVSKAWSFSAVTQIYCIQKYSPLPCFLVGKESQHKHKVHSACCAVSNKVLHLTCVFSQHLKLWQAHLLANQQGWNLKPFTALDRTLYLGGTSPGGGQGKEDRQIKMCCNAGHNSELQRDISSHNSLCVWNFPGRFRWRNFNSE